jgi:hypothetical protein
MIDHGTVGGYKKCKLEPGGACVACKKANSQYKSDWRNTNLEGRQKERDEVGLRRRGLTVLGRRHRTELNIIIDNLRKENNG